jgi:hypothetical protein
MMKAFKENGVEEKFKKRENFLHTKIQNGPPPAQPVHKKKANGLSRGYKKKLS